jgi:hypothetical protein
MAGDADTPVPPIACDMSGAADTLDERLAEYRRLFSAALIARERNGTGIRFRFRLEGGVEAWVRDLAAREVACCPFFTFVVAPHADELWWDASVPDDDAAVAMLDLLYRLADA